MGHCCIPVSGWDGVPKYSEVMLASGKKLCCPMSDKGQLAGTWQGTVLGSVSSVCRINYGTGYMHLCISEQALTTDPHGSDSPCACRVGFLPTHP